MVVQCGQLLRVKNSKKAQLWGGGGEAHFYEFYLLDLYQVPTVSIREQSAHGSRR